MSHRFERDVPAYRRPLPIAGQGPRLSLGPVPGADGGKRTVMMTLQIPIGEHLMQIIKQRGPTGEPFAPDDVLERLYEEIRNELIRRGKKDV